MKINFNTAKAILVSSITFGAIAPICHATVLFSDDFNYTTGTALQGQGGWAAVNTGDTIGVVAGNVSVPGYRYPAIGNSINFAGAGQEAAHSFTSQTTAGTTVYYSFSLNLSLASLNATGGYFAFFSESNSSSNFGGTLWARSDGTGFDLGVNPRTTAANTVFTSGTTSVSDTHFIVVAYTIVNGASNDTVSLWLNPSSTSFGGSAPTATVTATNSVTADLASVTSLWFRQDGTTATPNVTIDAVRVGTTWADVTPEPSSLSFIGLGIAGLLARRRRLVGV